MDLTTRTKSKATLKIFDAKIRHLVKFALSSEIYKVRVDIGKTLNEQIALPLTAELIKSFINSIVRKNDDNLIYNPTIGSYISAMAHLYDVNNMSMPDDELEALDPFINNWKL